MWKTKISVPHGFGSWSFFLLSPAHWFDYVCFLKNQQFKTEGLGACTLSTWEEEIRESGVQGH